MLKIYLTSCVIPDEIPIVRESPRPVAMRNELYSSQYDWKTLFYDVYSCGGYTVFQGPPLFNLHKSVMDHSFFNSNKKMVVSRSRACDIWVKKPIDKIVLEGPLGTFNIRVQPDVNHIFANKRVLLTLSKDNDLRWIIDWAQYHCRIHGAEALLFYDNASTAYSSEELQAKLSYSCPDMEVVVVSWPYKYGPQGGVSGAVNGRQGPWDSDFCQTAVLQHARFRFLQNARSVLNCDIDELIVAERGNESIFDFTEKRALGLTYFSGRWIGNRSDDSLVNAERRHRDFVCCDQMLKSMCPNKWCVVPKKTSRRFHTWTAHTIRGIPKFMAHSEEFVYRHFKAISNSWKYGRWDVIDNSDCEKDVIDEKLVSQLFRAGIGR